MYYFAYGLNLNSERNSKWQQIANGSLSDSKWLINEWGVATITPTKLSKTWGTVFCINQNQLDELDRFEGFPRYYDRTEQIVQLDNTKLLCWVYMDNNINPGTARPGYLEKVISGAIEQSLPASWIKELKKWMK